MKRSGLGRGMVAAAIGVLLAAVAARAGLPRERDWLVTPIKDTVQLSQSEDKRDLTLSNGLVSRTWRLRPNLACTSLMNLPSDGQFIRAVCPEAIITIEGVTYEVGGLKGAKDYGYLDPAWLDQMSVTPNSFILVNYKTAPVERPYEWKPRFGAPDVPWPPKGLQVIFTFKATLAQNPAVNDLLVQVHYELYEGAPIMTKWSTIGNNGPKEVVVEKMTCEQVAAPRHMAGRLQVEADFMTFRLFPIRWELDPRFATTTDASPNFHEYMLGEAIHYYPTRWLDNLWTVPTEDLLGVNEGGTRTLMSSRYPSGPGGHIAPGQSFKTYRTFLLLNDDDDRARQSLARRRLYRLLAPQTQENPIFFHCLGSDSASIRRAVDQCAELGFDMIIMTFGSGFNMYSDKPEDMARYKIDFDYAHAKGIKIGGYILFASSASHGENDARGTDGRLGSEYGRSLCLGTAYSDHYFKTLLNFIDHTGMDVIEADGPYHGYSCSATNHKYHRGKDDSYFVNWRRQCEFLAECVKRGVYIHVPDFYFFNGANRSALGYREASTFLPHWTKVIVARRNIYDGTVNKTPSMGWMQDPIAPGAAPETNLTPLSQHLDLYNWHLAQVFGSGVMAVWRNNVLYDDEKSKALVKGWVEFFHKYQQILSSDILQLRYPDGRDIDYFMHVNPRLKEKGLLMVFNQTDRPIKRTLRLPLYYTGVTGTTRIREQEGPPKTYTLGRENIVELPVSLSAKSITWFAIMP